jgi:hypothetical protein
MVSAGSSDTEAPASMTLCANLTPIRRYKHLKFFVLEEWTQMVAKTIEKIKNQKSKQTLNPNGNGANLSDADIEIIRNVGPEKFYGDGKATERGLMPVYIKF